MHLNNTHREKLLNAILYFCKHTKKTSKLKVFKLLFLLDFKHFKQTGRSVTGLDYYAWERGPVPIELFKELKDAGGAPDDFRAKLNLVGFQSEYSEKKGELCVAKRAPDMSVFSPRETKLIDELSFIFKDADADDMSEISHLKNQPWDLTMRTKGNHAMIDYLLALDQEAKISKEDAEVTMREQKEILKAFPPLPSLAK